MREQRLLDHVYAANPGLGDLVRIAPGDDMGMVESPSTHVLLAVDQLVAGRHVRLETTPIALVGRKAITRCLSDVAAMAARPLASLVAVTLPPDFGEDRAKDLFDAMRETAARYGAPLVGGDIAVHASATHPLVCAVTVLATPGPRAPVRRDGARVGDTIFVSGRLGGSFDADGGGAHLTFEPRIETALALASMLGDDLHAMIDVSDGLGRDVGRLARASGVAVRLDAARMPCRRGVDWRRAVADGEDYELCFAARVATIAPIGEVAFTAIGVVEARDDEADPVAIMIDGRAIPGSELGWDHGAC